MRAIDPSDGLVAGIGALLLERIKTLTLAAFGGDSPGIDLAFDFTWSYSVPVYKPPFGYEMQTRIATIGFDLGRIELLDAAETVPSLAEFLALVAGRAPLLIEIKDQDGALGPGVGPLERRVAALLDGYAGEAALMSFNPHSVAVFAEAAPDRPRGLTTCAFDSADWSLPDDRRAELAALADAERTGASFVSHDRKDLDNPALARLKREGLPILTWTVRSPAQEAEARRVADNITFEGYLAAL